MSKVKCYKCGIEYDENPNDENIFPKKCSKPDCEKSNLTNDNKNSKSLDVDSEIFSKSTSLNRIESVSIMFKVFIK